MRHRVEGHEVFVPAGVGVGARIRVHVDVEMPRGEYNTLRERLGLQTGSQVHLLARRITRFAEGRNPVVQEPVDPAAMI